MRALLTCRGLTVTRKLNEWEFGVCWDEPTGPGNARSCRPYLRVLAAAT